MVRINAVPRDIAARRVSFDVAIFRISPSRASGKVGRGGSGEGDPSPACRADATRGRVWFVGSYNLRLKTQKPHDLRAGALKLRTSSEPAALARRSTLDSDPR